MKHKEARYGKTIQVRFSGPKEVTDQEFAEYLAEFPQEYWLTEIVRKSSPGKNCYIIVCRLDNPLREPPE